MNKKIIGILICAILFFGSADGYSYVFAAEIEAEDLRVVNGEAADTDLRAVYEATGEYISGLGTPGVGSVGGEWMVIGLVRAGYDCPEGYIEHAVAYVEENINDKEQLHRVKSTENSRVILALTSAGYDVTDVGGHNLLKGLSDMSYLKKQGINGPVWALIAFDCYNYEIPQNENGETQTTREDIISYILSCQLEDGGWAISGMVADPDMTGMAIQALAPYYDADPDVMNAVERAVECLSAIQQDDGTYGSFDGSCVESCAQIIVALTALGINPDTDERFVKNGISVVDALCIFAVDGGGFEHTDGSGLNGMATEQGMYGLTSYFRFLEGKTSLYDMTDVEVHRGDVREEDYSDEYYEDEWADYEPEEEYTGEADVQQPVINEDFAKNIFTGIRMNNWNLMRVLSVSRRDLLTGIMQRGMTLLIP